MYTEKLPHDLNVQADALNLLKLVHKQGYENLKMLLELQVVQTKGAITMYPAIEYLLFVELHNCALLGKVAMETVVDGKLKIMDWIVW